MDPNGGINPDFPLAVDTNGNPLVPTAGPAGRPALPSPTPAPSNRTLADYKIAQRQNAIMSPTAVSNSGYSGNLAAGVTPPSNQKFADKVQDLTQDYELANPGSKALMVSGDRDNAKQARLYANYQAKQKGLPLPYPSEGQGGMAAPPGASAHNSGRAADITPVGPTGQYSPSGQNELNSMAAEPWRGITPGVVFGDNDHYQDAGVQPSQDAKKSYIGLNSTPDTGVGGGRGSSAGASSAGASSATPTPGSSGPSVGALYTLAMLKSLFPQHQFTHITYDPFAVMPKAQ